ncbi:hypothetical protein RB195_025465 [Necator americanus]
MPLCLTFIDLKKAFDSFETEAVMEALDKQGILTQYIKTLREFYSEEKIQQVDTISPKIFTLENAMRKLEWDDMGVKHLSSGTNVNEFDETCGGIGLQLNLRKMGNGWVSNAPSTINGTNISECISYVYLGRKLNMMNDLTPELGKRKRAAYRVYKIIEEIVRKTKNTCLRAHPFSTTVLPALTYGSEN